MSYLAHVVAASTPPPTSNTPLPSAASNGGTLLFFFIVAGIALIGFFMVRSMRSVNRHYEPGPDGVYIGDGPDEKSEKSSNESKSSTSNDS